MRSRFALHAEFTRTLHINLRAPFLTVPLLFKYSLKLNLLFRSEEQLLPDHSGSVSIDMQSKPEIIAGKSGSM